MAEKKKSTQPRIEERQTVDQHLARANPNDSDPRKAIINDCTWGNGFVSFSWKPVDGALKYRLVVKDELLHTKLIQDQDLLAKTVGNKFSTELRMSEELRIGRTCMTKVHVYFAGEETFETDWKSHILGGEKVPRNVKALKNLENPERSVFITFDCPMKGPAPQYKIVAIPETGLKRTTLCKTRDIMMEYLRKGVKYKFKVYAKWGSDWSEGSPSNSFSTEGDKSKLFMRTDDMGRSNLDVANAVLKAKSSGINVNRGKNFGQVEDLEAITAAVKDKDVLTLKWKAPNFGNETAGHKVELYEIEICKQDGSGKKTYTNEFKKDRFEYQSEKIELELGETYNVGVSTIYMDIDQDRVFKSTAIRREIAARPCVPQCVRNDYCNDVLRLEWNATKGADSYELELFVNHAVHPARVNMGNNTAYEKTFDEEFGYGTSYYAVIKAFGVSGKPNCLRTPAKIIGGDDVPTDVSATSNHKKVTDTSTQVFLNWTAPRRLPKKYEVVSFPYAKSLDVDIDGTKCLVSGLKPGTEYFFKVKALHEVRGKFKPSGGCYSNRISTAPTPKQVTNVWTRLGENPSTSVKISWEKVDAEKENETTKYRVRLLKDDETIQREVYVSAETLILKDLDSDSAYFVTVAGGNSMGYGKDSEKVRFRTDLGSPKNVILKNNEEKLASSLILLFSHAEGEPTSYVAVLYKITDNLEEPVNEPMEVEAGSKFQDLEASTEYFVTLYARFASGDGKAVASEVVTTGASKPRITDCRCGLLPNGEKNPRELFVRWKSDKDCSVHEIVIDCSPTNTIESRLTLENRNELNYSCINESSLYSVRVRSRTMIGHFGEWSDEAPINIVPQKPQGVSAALGKGYDIIVQCDAALDSVPRYFMQVLCNDEEVGDPKESHEENGKCVKWRFTPLEYAQVYQFKLWTENYEGMKGENTMSRPVISRPSKMAFEKANLSLAKDYESTDIMMAWEKQQRCDMYEIKICVYDEEVPEKITNTRKIPYRYRCYVPGGKYLVSVRALREGFEGEWSNDVLVILVPTRVHFLADLNDSDKPVSCVEVNWEPLDVPPSGYQLKLFCDDKEVDKVITTATSHKFVDNLMPGSLCFCTVVAFNESELTGKESKSRTFRIKWLQASNFIIENNENDPSRIAMMKWDAPQGVDCFRLEIEDNQNGVVSQVHLSTPSYDYTYGVPGNTYIVRLYCGCNDKYDTKHVVKTMTMNPFPPEDLWAENFQPSPHDSIQLSFKDSRNKGSSITYEVAVEDETGDDELSSTTTSDKKLVVKGLKSGVKYWATVQAVKNGRRSEKRSTYTPVMTAPPPVEEIKMTVDSSTSRNVTWNASNGALQYALKLKKDGCSVIQIGTTNDCEYYLQNLDVHSKYTLHVIAENDGGKSKDSAKIEFETGPSTPTKVKAKAISTRQVQFTCEECLGATEYIFKVNGRSYSTKGPELILPHERSISEFDFNVSASNIGGSSVPSQTLHYSQPLLKLQQKNLRNAEFYNSKFITPSVSDVPSESISDDFGTTNFCVGHGNTVCLFGTEFSGKTSCALKYLQNLSEDILPIFLDWDHYKSSKVKCDVKSVLSEQMKSFGEVERNFIFEWMKSHSEQVVFVVDDLLLSHNVSRKVLFYDNLAFVEEVFYNITTTERKIFTQSQVLCSTSQRDLRHIIKPTQALAINGFDDKQIQEMTKMEFGTERDIPNHLKFFCVSPSFCVRIIQLMKTSEPKVDMQSYSSVLMKLISDSVSRYPDEKKKEKLTVLWDEVRHVPQKLKTDSNIDPLKRPKRSLSIASTTGGSQSQISDIRSFIDLQENIREKNSCETLHDQIIKAMYFALCCLTKEFKGRFHKKSIKLASNSKIWILAAGLLREHTANNAEEVFQAADCTINKKDMSEKLRFIKKFVENNLEEIHHQMKIDSKITLDWLDIVNEIDAHNILSKSDWKVSVKNRHDTQEIEQMANFLIQARGIFFKIIRVKLEKELAPSARIPIETAMKHNPDGEIYMDSSIPTASSRHSALNLSFRAKVATSSTLSEHISTLHGNDEALRSSCLPFNDSCSSCSSSSRATAESLKTVQNDDDVDLEVFESVTAQQDELGPTGSNVLNADRDQCDSLHGLSLHGEPLASPHGMATHEPIIDIASLPVIPWPVEFLDSECFVHNIPTNFARISNVFTINQDREVSVACSAQTYIVPKKTFSAKLLRLVHQKWEEVKDVQIVEQIACFQAGEGGIYVLAQVHSGDLSLPTRYIMTCRMKLASGCLILTISPDDGYPFRDAGHTGVMKQRFFAKSNDQFNLKVTIDNTVICDWNVTIDPQFGEKTKTIHNINQETAKYLICSIYHGHEVVSQARIASVEPEQPPSSCDLETATEVTEPSMPKQLRINIANLPETAVFIEFPTLATRNETVQFVAKSLSSGKEISAISSNGSAIIQGIDPGDKYFVSAYLHDQLNGVCIAKSEIQTGKTIGYKGGSVTVGNFHLDFPEGAIHDKSIIEVLPLVENIPNPPTDSVFVLPPVDFRSTQKVFSKIVTCKWKVPYVRVEKAVEVDIFYYENNEWFKLCSTWLTPAQMLTFKCTHFTIFAVTIYSVLTRAPYSLVRNIPFLSYEMCNYIYFDKDDNFIGVTCLNDKPTMQDCHHDLSELGYIRTRHVIFPNLFKKFQEGPTIFTLKCCEPIHLIGNWEMSLDEEFVRNHWRDLKNLDGMRDDIGDTNKIKLSFKRENENEAPKEWTVKLGYPLKKNFPSEPFTVHGNLFQGGSPTVHMTGAQAIRTGTQFEGEENN